jgi:hypothetical protein
MVDDPIPAIQFLERVLGTRVAAIVRWLLFLPAGLVLGIGLFLLFGVGGANAAQSLGDDVTAPAAFFGGIIAGGFSVYAAMRVAPGCPRTVAGVSGIACVALAALLIFWARASHRDDVVISTIIAGATYSFGAVMTAVIFVFRLHQKK